MHSGPRRWWTHPSLQARKKQSSIQQAANSTVIHVLDRRMACGDACIIACSPSKLLGTWAIGSILAAQDAYLQRWYAKVHIGMQFVNSYQALYVHVASKKGT